MDLRILSFESTNQSVSVALLQGGVVVSQTSHKPSVQGLGENRQTVQTVLMPLIDRLIKDQNWAKDSIDCIVVGIGPGSFTSVRTAVVTARSLAQALVLPLIGVSIFDSYAHCIQKQYSRKFGIILSSGKGNYLISLCSGQEHPFGEDSGLEHLACNQDELRLTLSQAELWFADEQAKAGLLDTCKFIQELPQLKNIAATQAVVAWDWLCSLINTMSNTTSKSLSETLRKQFPFSRVRPLYLRGASVTIRAESNAVSF